MIHDVLGLLAGLNHGAHVRMEAELDAVLHSELAQLVQSVAQTIHLLLRCSRMVAEHRDIFGKRTAGDLCNVDVLAVQNGQINQVLEEALLVVLKIALAQGGGEPAAADFHAADIQTSLEHGHIGRILASNLGALESCQSSLTQALLKCVLLAQRRHIVVGPGKR